MQRLWRKCVVAGTIEGTINTCLEIFEVTIFYITEISWIVYSCDSSFSFRRRKPCDRIVSPREGIMEENRRGRNQDCQF